jgi:hypothetical protein
VPDWAEGGIAAETAPAAAEADFLPDWLAEADTDVELAEIPDWLAETDVDVQPDEVPAWLLDTVETEASLEDAIITPAPQPAAPPAAAPKPAAQVVVPVAAPKAPPPPPAADVEEALSAARAKATSGDLDGSLYEYERIIRSNSGLDHVAADLAALVESQSSNPAVYRVLGDCQMRQGQLQAALDTYRKALNQL